MTKAPRSSDMDAETPSSCGYEVHEHCFIRGPRANGSRYKFSHSHMGGDRPHRHTDTGPACYTIDKDDWLRATGMVGGGRKRFTRNPTGEQLPLILLPHEETTFEVIGFDPPRLPPDFKGNGGGMQAVSRMALSHRLRPIFRVIRGDKP